MDDLNARFAQAVAAHRAGDHDRAEALYRALPEHPKILQNLGVLLAAVGRLAEAEAELRRVLELSPGLGTAANSLSRVLLAQGRYAEAWPLHEARRRDPATPMPSAELPAPEWRGEPLAGMRLLVVGEQGFGDQIMFARFLEPLRAMAATTIFVCAPALARLFAGLGVEVAPGSAGQAPPPADYAVFLCSLPGLLGVALETLPPPARIAAATHDGGGGLGVVTRGRPTHGNDAHRSLDPAAAARLLALGRDISPEATGARDFQDTAEIVAGLDLVVSVDTAVAHLAASLGKPTWILLPHVGTDWRWMREREDSPWYPAARLFRQPTGGDWGSVIDAVEGALDAGRPPAGPRS